MRLTNFIKTALLPILSTLLSTIMVSGAGKDDINDINFTHFSVNEGLSHGTVLSCCQDSLGHMWFATNDGLNRYDGYEFHVYRNNEDDTTSIASNIIRKVYCSCNGQIWVGTESGLSRYDIETDCFRNFSTSGKTVTGIVEIEYGSRLMVASGGGLYFFDMQSLSWDRSAPPARKKASERPYCTEKMKTSGSAPSRTDCSVTI